MNLTIGPGEYRPTVLTDGRIGLRKGDDEIFVGFANPDAALDFVSEVAETARWLLWHGRLG